MNFYTRQHLYYCGIDLHAKTMYLCIINQQGDILLQRNIRTHREVFLKTIERYREDIVVAVECIFTWYAAKQLIMKMVLKIAPEVNKAVFVFR